MDDLPGRIRDATFQVVADACDERWGLNCFRLARAATCGHVAGYLATGYLVATSDVPGRGGAATVTLVLAAVLGSAAAWKVAYLAGFERRMASSHARAVVPFIGTRAITALNLCLLGVGIVAPTTLMVYRIVSGGQATPDVAAAAFLALYAAAALQPTGWLFAGCEWRRLHRPRERDVRAATRVAA